jgi:hypothetical protein
MSAKSSERMLLLISCQYEYANGITNEDKIGMFYEPIKLQNYICTHTN